MAWCVLFCWLCCCWLILITGVFSYISDERIELFKVAVDAASDWQGDDVGDNEKQPESYEFIILKRFPGQIPCKRNVIIYFENVMQEE